VTVSEKEIIFRELGPIAGLHPFERDQLGPFVWTRGKFSIRKPEGIRYLDLFFCYYGTNGRLVIGKDSAHGPVEITLIRGWSRYAVDLRNLGQCDLDFEVTPVVAVPGEPRELGVMIRHVRPFKNVKTYEHERRKMTNKYENSREFFSGRATLNSLPTKMRMDIEDRCNMLPRCSYCEWEWVKETEKHSRLGEPLNVFEELAQFFDHAEEVVDCSFGEPFLNPSLEAILNRITAIGAHMEMTSNGHLLDRTNRSKLLGRDLRLYISLDAATDANYRRFRSGSMDTILTNIRALNEERRDHDSLPQIAVSFIAMRSNVAEFEAFLDCMGEVGVDAVKVKGLRPNPRLSSDTSVRDSRGFDYQREIMPLADLMSFLDVATTSTESKGIQFINELEFCRELEGLDTPLCTEPWQALYPLRRGIVPCCYSRIPQVPWEHRKTKPLAQFVAEVWNSGPMRELRQTLAAGELHEICKTSADCPVARRKSLGR
jgi:MoaA/NifB/PqqE/SkfB family radical SAM enzyme